MSTAKLRLLQESFTPEDDPQPTNFTSTSNTTIDDTPTDNYQTILLPPAPLWNDTSSNTTSNITTIPFKNGSWEA